jgi:hypothetical protein
MYDVDAFVSITHLSSNMNPVLELPNANMTCVSWCNWGCRLTSAWQTACHQKPACRIEVRKKNLLDRRQLVIPNNMALINQTMLQDAQVSICGASGNNSH